MRVARELDVKIIAITEAAANIHRGNFASDGQAGYAVGGLVRPTANVSDRIE
jgi:hypothetical protein